METSPEPRQPQAPDQSETVGPETWVREAIAQQEEHLKRSRSCTEILGRAHTYRDFGQPDPDGTIAFTHTWRECLVCGVTETDTDYQSRRNATAPQ